MAVSCAQNRNGNSNTVIDRIDNSTDFTDRNNDGTVTERFEDVSEEVKEEVIVVGDEAFNDKKKAEKALTEVND